MDVVFCYITYIFPYVLLLLDGRDIQKKYYRRRIMSF